MSTDPRTCTTMAELRAEIDRIDSALVELIARRIACIDRAIALKPGEGLPARITPRVDEVAANVARAAGAWGLDPADVEALWREIIEWSIAREAGALGEG